MVSIPTNENEIDMSSVTYELKEDLNDHNKFYIRSAFPLCYITDNMTKREINKIAKSMRQLGFVVIDKTKKENS